MAALMRAVQYDSYGGGVDGLKHVEVPVPTPGKGEVLLKLEATSLNPYDVNTQKGLLRPFRPAKFPFIPGCDVAGEVVKVGPRVANFKPGDKVIAALNHGAGGGLAEYVVSKTNLTVPRPPEVSAAEGAAIVVAGLTALGAITQAAGLKLDGSGPLKNILVTAASGGVGVFAVQIAKLANTHVTATCGARNIDLVKSLGADEVIDYKTPEGAALKSPSGKKYDVVIQCARFIPGSTRVTPWSVFEPNLSSDGKVIDLNPAPSAWWTFVTQKLTFSKKLLVPYIYSDSTENMIYLAELVKQGKMKVVIDSTFPLSEAKAAWAKISEGHATGKIIVEP